MQTQHQAAPNIQTKLNDVGFALNRLHSSSPFIIIIIIIIIIRLHRIHSVHKMPPLAIQTD